MLLYSRHLNDIQRKCDCFGKSFIDIHCQSPLSINLQVRKESSCIQLTECPCPLSLSLRVVKGSKRPHPYFTSNTKIFFARHGLLDVYGPLYY